MPTVTAQTIIDRAELILNDTTNVRWAAAELLGWLNDGQREAVIAKPDVYTKSQAVQLTAGTKQTLPSDAILLLDVVRNMGTNGTTVGNTVRVVAREVLDAQVPNWHTLTASNTVVHYMVDPRDPKRYYVYPKSPGTNYVEIVYSAAPPDVALIADTISIDDVYANALLDYILYRAYMKDATFAGNDQRAANHYAAFMSALGLKVAGQASHNPNLKHQPFNPNLPGSAQ